MVVGKFRFWSGTADQWCPFKNLHPAPRRLVRSGVTGSVWWTCPDCLVDLKPGSANNPSCSEYRCPAVGMKTAISQKESSVAFFWSLNFSAASPALASWLTEKAEEYRFSRDCIVAIEVNTGRKWKAERAVEESHLRQKALVSWATPAGRSVDQTGEYLGRQHPGRFPSGPGPCAGSLWCPARPASLHRWGKSETASCPFVAEEAVGTFPSAQAKCWLILAFIKAEQGVYWWVPSKQPQFGSSDHLWGFNTSDVGGTHQWSQPKTVQGNSGGVLEQKLEDEPNGTRMQRLYGTLLEQPRRSQWKLLVEQLSIWSFGHSFIWANIFSFSILAYFEVPSPARYFFVQSFHWEAKCWAQIIQARCF